MGVGVSLRYSHTLQRVLTCEWIDGCKITDASGLERMKVDRADVCSLLQKTLSTLPFTCSHSLLYHSYRCAASWWRHSVSRYFRLASYTEIRTLAIVSVHAKKEVGEEWKGRPGVP